MTIMTARPPSELEICILIDKYGQMNLETVRDAELLMMNLGTKL